jgi:putative addiction module component
MVTTVRSSERVEPILLSIMSRLTEIQKAIEELAPEEKEELRDWLGGYDPATEREWAAIAQERIRQIESGEVAPLDGEQVLKEMHHLAKQLAQE